MEIQLLAFGIAKDILGTSRHPLEIEDSASIATVKRKLLEKYPDFERLANLRFAVNEDYKDDDYQIEAGDEVVIIPPVSGG